MPIFYDSENIPALLQAGDYIWCCVGCEIGLSNTPKTNGAEKYEMKIEIEPSGKKIRDMLIDHETCAWKIDTFLKSAGVKLKKGESYDFREDKAAALKARWINPEGLRGWCAVIVEDYVGKDGKKKQSNKVSVYYVDREKLPRREIAEEEKPF